MDITTPLYRLQELIIAKYGEEKFGLGCELVASWLNINSAIDFTPAMVKYMCHMNDKKLDNMNRARAEKLMKLFGLKSVKELYTRPEDTHELLLYWS